VAEVSIDAALVSALVRAQHPQFADIPLGECYEGWDNTILRLGAEWAVRLPRRATSARLIAHECAWLPRMSENWTFAASIPLAHGRPGEGFPWEWAIVPWIEGSVAYDVPLHALGARQLGRALAEIHQPVDASAPRNPYRSTPLGERAERLDMRLGLLEREYGTLVDCEHARQVYALGARERPSVLTWAHLDLHGGNVLTTEGDLAGIIDWGDAAAGDPATDLGHVLALVGRRRFRDVVRGYADAGGAAAARSGLSEQTARRVEAEAVGYAVTLASISDSEHCAAGWRALTDLGFATCVPDNVLAEAGLTAAQGAA